MKTAETQSNRTKAPVLSLKVLAGFHTAPGLYSWKQRISDIIDHSAFREGVSESIQKDGQKVLDAAFKGDTATLENFMTKYARDKMRDQGGVGAGPGKVKQPRRGAVAVWQGARIALDNITKPEAPAGALFLKGLNNENSNTETRVAIVSEAVEVDD